MGAITLPKEMQTELAKLKERTELQDADGKMIGIFTPREQAEAELIEEARQLFDLEEAERRLATEKPGRTTQEVLARLKAMESSK